MMAISSKQGYPNDDQLLIRVDYRLGIQPDGIILIVGKDSQGKEYRPRTAQEGSYQYLSGGMVSVPHDLDERKNYPALFFSFQLNSSRWQPKIVDGRLEETKFDDDFYRKFDFKLLDEKAQSIVFPDTETEMEFKELAVWGAYELHGLLAAHFWGEMYVHRDSTWEKFLEEYRG